MILTKTLQLLHPFMPFITEEIYQNLPGHTETIMQDRWPEPLAVEKAGDAAMKMQSIMNIIRAIRNIRAEFNINPGKAIKAHLLVRDPEQLSILTEHQSYIMQMANVSEITAGQELAKIHQAVSAITAAAEIYVPLEGVIDVDKELVRLNKDLQNTIKDIEKSEAKLNNEQFLSRAPQEVIEKEKAKVQEGNIKKEGILKRLQMLQA